MKVEDPPLAEALAARREAVVGQWLARALSSYPPHTARVLREDPDPFRNPVGAAFKQGLPALFDELLGAMDPARLRKLLDSLVRIRAVQDFTPSQAVGFLFLLKDVLREQGPAPPELERRIDQLVLEAFDLYSACREQIAQIRAAEARRAVTGYRPGETGRTACPTGPPEQSRPRGTGGSACPPSSPPGDPS